jgi:hypothetical protein
MDLRIGFGYEVCQQFWIYGGNQAEARRLPTNQKLDWLLQQDMEFLFSSFAIIGNRAGS